MIESGNEVVDRITHDNRASLDKLAEFWHVIDKQNVFSGIFLELESESWTVRFDREHIGNVLVQAVAVPLLPARSSASMHRVMLSLRTF